MAKEENAFMGIDLGSTSCRVSLYPAETNRMIQVRYPHRSRDRNKTDAGEFPCFCYPFMPGSTIRDDPENPKKNKGESASLKPILLLLSELPAEDLESLIAEYPLAKQILNNMGSGPFRDKLRRGIQGLFTEVWDAVQELCCQSNLVIIGIGITTPRQWPEKVQGVYKDLLLSQAPDECRRRIFDDVHFLGEAQALGHYLCHHLYARIKGQSSTSDDDTLLILDFGGQNLNTSMYHIEYDNERKPYFFEIPGSHGVVGGGEQFDYQIGEYCEQYLLKTNRTLPPGTKQGFIDRFCSAKRDLDKNFEIDGELGTLMLVHSRYVVELSPKVIEEAFLKALGQPLAQAKMAMSEAIKILGCTGSKGPWTLVTGGTTGTVALQNRLKAMCEEYGLRPPMFVDQEKIGSQDRAYRISQGAAYFIASTLSVEEFMGHSAVGLQMRQFVESGDKSWDSEAKVLLREGKTARLTMQLEDNDKLRLICSPSLNGLCEGKHGKASILASKSYDLHCLGFVRGGRLKAEGHLIGDDKNLCLVVKFQWHPDSSPGDKHRTWQHGSVTLPLYPDRASRCVLSDPSLVVVDLQYPAGFISATPFLETRFRSSSSKGTLDQVVRTAREAVHQYGLMTQNAGSGTEETDSDESGSSSDEDTDTEDEEDLENEKGPFKIAKKARRQHDSEGEEYTPENAAKIRRRELDRKRKTAVYVARWRKEKAAKAADQQRAMSSSCSMPGRSSPTS